MRLLYLRTQELLKKAASSHLSDLFADPPEMVLIPIIEAAHRFKSTLVFDTRKWQPFTRVALLTGRRDIEEVLLRGDVFSVREYLVRMTMTSGAFFLGLDEDAKGRGSAYGLEKEKGAHALGKRVGREWGFGADAYEDAALRRVREIVAKSANDAVDERRHAGSLDVARDLAWVVPMNLLQSYFGIPEIEEGGRKVPGELGRNFKAMSDHIFNFFATGPELREPAVRAGAVVRRHLENVLRAPPRDQDLVLNRLRARFQAGEDVVRTLAGMASGAMVPTAGQFLHVANCLLKLPEGHRRTLHSACVKGDLDVVRGYAREGARFYPYPPTVYRVCVSDHVLGAGSAHETRISAGTLVVTAFIGASFDRDYVSDPWRFDPRRPRDESLYFGFGTHQCVGAYIGEEMLTQMTRALFALPGLRFSRREPQRGTQAFDSLPVSFNAG